MYVHTKDEKFSDHIEETGVNRLGVDAGVVGALFQVAAFDLAIAFY